MSVSRGHVQEKLDEAGNITAYRAVITHPHQLTKSGTAKRLSAQYSIGPGMSRAQAHKAANDWLDETRQSFKEGRDVATKSKISLSDAADAWLNKIEIESTSGKGKLRPSTLSYYDFIVRCYIHEPPAGVEDIGPLRLNALSHKVIDQWKDSLIISVSRSAAQRALMTLKQILRYAIGEYGLKSNPASDVKLGSETNKDESITIMLEREHVKLMLKVGKSLYEKGWYGKEPETRIEKSNVFQRKRAMAHLYPFLRLAFSSGARTGEILGAKVWDFNFEENTFFVQRTVTKEGKLGPPKTKRGVRVLAIDPGALSYVKARIDALGLKKGDLVFAPAEQNGLGEEDLYISGSNLYRSWKRFLAAVDQHLDKDLAPLILPDGEAITGPYHTRHYHASELLRQGVPLTDVSERLGHADTVITQKHYLHVLGDRKQASANAAARFAAIFEDTNDDEAEAQDAA